MVPTFEDYFQRLEKMQRWIRDDLSRSALQAKANFLVAMGIFNYAETLGSFYYHTPGNLAQRFTFAFCELMGAPYKKVFDELGKFTNNSAYDCLRCGMTHEYLVKTYPGNNIEIDFTVYGVDDMQGYVHNITSKPCGIELVSLETNRYHLRIYNPKLISDLDLAFENYKKRLLANTTDYHERFIQRCQDIHLEKFN